MEFREDLKFSTVKDLVLDLDLDEVKTLMGVTVFGVNGSTEKSSLTEKSESLVLKLKGAVGLATPNLTGASKALADSQSSSTAMLMSPWNTRLHFCMGWLMLEVAENCW